MHTRTAFTMIELLIAMALGLIIAGTAFAAFRLASTSFATAQQLVRQNGLLVEGYFAGVDDADFWYSCDDPGDPSGHDQRQAYHIDGTLAVVGTDGGYGQPFVPMDLPDEYWNWSVGDPKTWSRIGWYIHNVYASNAELACIGHPDAQRRWLPEMTDRLYHHLGLGGYVEYLPPGLPWSWYLASDGSNSFGNSMVLGERQGSHVPTNSLNAISKMWFDGLLTAKALDRSNEHPAHGTGRAGHFNNVAQVTIAPRRGSQADPQADNAAILAASRGVQYYNGSGPLGVGAETQALSGSLLATPPITRVTSSRSGSLSVTVSRVAKVKRSWTSNVSVVVTDPLDGSHIGITFHLPATSLRGARQQRAWPHWGGTILDQ